VSEETFEKIKDQLTVDVKPTAKERDGMRYCIIRTYSAGVFAGYINTTTIDKKCGTVYNSRRIWYWKGAATLSQLAVDGTSKPDECKFPCEVEEKILTEIIEVIPCTQKSFDSIRAVKTWKS